MDIGIWIRVSTEDQARGESPKNHEHRARIYAELKNWNIVEFYDLSGVSGKSVIDHPIAKRMFADVKSGRIKALIFTKIARLVRKTRELLEISDYFQKYNADLVSLEESIDTSTPAGRLLFTVIGALAQWEREEISSRVAASVPVRAMQGKPTGGIGPFGYMWVDKRLILNPAEAPVVSEIFNTFLETKKLLKTARILNNKGYRSRNGVEFGKTSIKRILIDTTYKGLKRANYSRSKGNKKSWAIKPEKDWVYFKVEPIILEKLWDEVNAIIKLNSAPYPSTPPPIGGRYAFSGLVTCGDCKKKMYVMANKWMKTPQYSCRACKTKIDEFYIFDQFKEGLKCMIVTPEQLKGSQESEGQAIAEKTKALVLLKKEAVNIGQKIDKLFNFVLDDKMNKDTFSERIIKMQKRKKQVEDEIPRLEGEIDFMKTSNIGKSHVLTQASTLYSLWDNIDMDNRVKIVKEILSQVIVTKQEVVFEFFYLSEFMELCKPDHTDRDAVWFAKQHQFKLPLPRHILPPKGYPVNPKLIGEHIRKKRLDLGLLQIEVAVTIGVTESTVWNWEHGTEPELRYIPEILNFLSYIPWEEPDTVVGKLSYFKKNHGLSYERLGLLMGKSAEQITDWLSGNVKPGEKNIQEIIGFLGDN